MELGEKEVVRREGTARGPRSLATRSVSLPAGCAALAGGGRACHRWTPAGAALWGWWPSVTCVVRLRLL